MEKGNEKQTKYRQLAFELRERRVGYNVVVVPLVIGALGGGVKEDSWRDAEDNIDGQRKHHWQSTIGTYTN